jgi:hypothetical protein
MTRSEYETSPGKPGSIARSSSATSAAKRLCFRRVVTEGFRFDALVTVDRAHFGESLVRYTLQKEDSGMLDPLLLLLRSASSEGASGAMRSLLDERFVAPLATWLGGENASERAALIAAQMIGLTFLRFVVKLDALTNADREYLIAQTAPTLQRWVDGL